MTPDPPVGEENAGLRVIIPRVKSFAFASLPGRQRGSHQQPEALGLPIAAAAAASWSVLRLEDGVFHGWTTSGRPMNIHCDVYRTVEASAQIPSVSIPRYFLGKVRAGTPDL